MTSVCSHHLHLFHSSSSISPPPLPLLIIYITSTSSSPHHLYHLHLFHSSSSISPPCTSSTPHHLYHLHLFHSSSSIHSTSLYLFLKVENELDRILVSSHQDVIIEECPKLIASNEVESKYMKLEIMF